jgi:DNA (cytosine-5)-methyltransferase 1
MESANINKMIAISKYNKQHPLRVFEAFAGYGSQSLAFKYLQENHPEFDFKVVGYSEIEPSAIQAYRLLHGWDIPNFGDVTRIDWNEVPDFDFISWSSPCQDFSNAGLRQGGEEGSGTRSSLIFQEKRMLAVKKPKYVMLENVKGLLSEKMRKYFFQYLRDLDSFGYTSFYKVLNSKDYGIPQNRERIFVISILRTEDEPNPEYHFPSPIKLETTVEDMLEDNVSPEYFMSQQLLEKYLSKADINEAIQKSIQIRKYTPRDCFRLMGVHEADIDKLLSKEKSGQLIICKSKLYALAGNSIVTNCLTAMFEELIFPSGNHYHDKSGQLSLF